MESQMNSAHQETKAVLKIIGPCVAIMGLILALIGFGSFFTSFGSFEPPRFFWCAFLGMPLLAVGGVISKFAFMGQVARYMANEIAPVGKDTFNYMADGTKDAVRDLASAVGDGLREGGAAASTSPEVRCHKCNAINDSDANFCNGCGAALQKSKACGHCNELNDPDARFCDNCGQGIA